MIRPSPGGIRSFLIAMAGWEDVADVALQWIASGFPASPGAFSQAALPGLA